MTQHFSITTNYLFEMPEVQSATTSPTNGIGHDGSFEESVFVSQARRRDYCVFLPFGHSQKADVVIWRAPDRPITTLTHVKSAMKRHPWLRGYGFSQIDMGRVEMAVKTPPYRKNLADILRAVRKDGFKFRRPLHPEAIQVGGSSYPTLKKGPVKIGIDALPIFPGRHGTLVGMHPMTDGLTVAGIVTDPAHRRKGLATAALQKVKAAADSKNVKLLLEPTPIKSATPKGGKAMNSRQLKKWYGKMGFRPYKQDDPTASVLTSLSARIEFGSAGIKRLLRQKLGVMKRGIYIEAPSGSPSLQLTPGASMMMVSKADRPLWKGARQREAYKTESAIDRIYRKKGAVDGDPFFRQQEIFDGKEYAIEKRLKRGFSRIDRERVEMSQAIGYEGGVPLTGRIARDRWVKKLRDEDLDRRDANLGRAGAAGAIAGALFPSRKMGLYKRMGIGAVAGTAGVLGVRQATKNTRDAYGERSRGAKRAEAIPAAAGLTAAGLLGAKKLGILKKFRMQSAECRVVELGSGGMRRILRRYYSNLSKGPLVQGVDPPMQARLQGTAMKLFPEHQLVRAKQLAPHIPALEKAKVLGFRGVADKKLAEELNNVGRARIDGSGALPSVYAHAQNPDLASVDHTRIVKRQALRARAGGKTRPAVSVLDVRSGRRIEATKVSPIEVAHSAGSDKLVRRAIREGHYSNFSHEFEKPFEGYNAKRHAKTGGLNDKFRQKYNREHGSNLKRPVTTEPSKLKPGSKAAKRRKSFCSRMSGVPGPTSKDGKLTPKGAALKRWNCSAEVASIEFAEKKEKGLNPYVGATASGAISGAGLGFIPTILRNRSNTPRKPPKTFLKKLANIEAGTLKGALKAGGLGALASGAIVGGGALIGSKILGEPREDEGSAFTKRAAIGGTIAGAGAGLAGGILLRKTRGGAKLLVGASKNWRPAQWLRKSPLAGSAAIGAVGGAIYGGGSGADEGQQVDSFRHLRKDLRKDVKAAAMKLEGKVGGVQFSVGSEAARKFLIIRRTGHAEAGTVVGKASSLKSARRVRDKHDLKYGAVSHKIVDDSGKQHLFAQKDWRDARRESRSEAIKDAMVGGGALAAGVGVGGGALWAARKFGQNADKAGAAADQVTATLKGVTKPRFVRSRQWLKKQMSFPTFGKVMKKFRLENIEFAMSPVNAKLVAAMRRSAGQGLFNIGKPTKDMKALIAAERARQPSWNRGLKNKLRNALDMLALENKQRLTEFYMLRQDLTEEQRNVRNAVVAGAVGMGAATGVAAVGLRSLKKADEAMRGARVWNRPRYSRAFEPLPGMTTPKKNLTPTMQDKWEAAKARTASSQGSGRVIRVDAPQAMARQAEARRIKEVRAVSRAPIADPVAGSRASTKARVAQGRKLQKIASVGNAGVLSRGERLAAAGALAAFRKKFRFEHHFAMPYRDKDGKAAGVGTWLRGEQIYDTEMNPTSMGVGTLANKMSRYSQQGWRETRRGANLMRDFREVARGEKTKKREWEKSYFKDRVAGALGTAGLIAGAVVYRKGGKYGAPKWAQKWHGAVNKVGGGIKRANTTASDWLNKQVNGFEAGSRAIEFADPRNRMEKASDGIADGLGYVYTAGGGAGAGAVAGRLLAGARKPALIAGAALGAAAGVGLRKSYGEKITAHRKARAEKQSTQPWQAWKHEQKAETLNVAPAVLGLAGGALLLKASPKILSASNRYGNRFRQWRGRMGAKMPVSKATQDARFAKAKPARAWEVGASQAAPSNWPRLAMESRMAATLQMFEGYGPYGYQDYYSAPGWDLRDARGKSARVFAPGSKKRVRRPAEWHEKKDNQKKLIAGAGLAAALLAGGGGLYAGRKLGLKAAMKSGVYADSKPNELKKMSDILGKAWRNKANEGGYEWN